MAVPAAIPLCATALVAYAGKALAHYAGVGSLGEFVGEALAHTLPHAAHDALHKLIERAADTSHDPATGLPRNHDLQLASADALRGAALVLVLEVAGEVDRDKPWLPSLAEHLRARKMWRLFRDDAVAHDPRRQWLAKLHAALAGDPKEFRAWHDTLALNEADLRTCFREGGCNLRDKLAGEFLTWARATVGPADEPPGFESAVAQGWESGTAGRRMTLGDAYCVFFREMLKHRPEVFRIFVTDTLAGVEQRLEKFEVSFAGFARSLDGQLAELRGEFAIIGENLGNLLRGQADLREQIGGLAAAVTMLVTERSRGNSAATVELRRLHGVEAQLEYLIGGIPLLPLPTPRPAKTELEFLQQQYRALSFTGRAAELQSLHDWLLSPAHISARLVIGRAGAGKTRLGYEFMRAVADELPHWEVRLLTEKNARDLAAKDLTRLAWTAPTLVLVDYAQVLARPLSLILEALTRRQGSDEVPRLRLLLLEREAGPWFDQLLGAGGVSSHTTCAVRELFSPQEAVPVAPLAPSLRRELLAEAFRGAAGIAGRKAPVLPAKGAEAVEIDRLLANERFGEPLHVAMVAVIAVSGGSITAALSKSRIDLATLVAQRELARVRRFARQPGNAAQEQLLMHLTSCATLERGFTSDELARAVKEESVALGMQWPDGLGDLQVVLRESRPAERLAVAPVEPDFVGEALVLNVLAMGINAPAAQRWPEVVHRCALRDPLNTPATLIHAWQNFGSSTAHAQSLLAATDVLIATAQKTRDENLLRGLEAALPETSVELLARAVKITQALYDLLCAKATRSSGESLRAELGRVANNLANRLGEVGRLEEALVPAQEAVRRYRELVKKSPDAFRADLATALNNFSICLSEMGRREEALVPAREAVVLYSELAEKRPDAFRPDLAMALNNLANRLGAVGQREEALVPAQKAVGLYRELADKNTEVFRPYLAKALNNLAIKLSELGRLKEALAPGQEAAEIYRELADKNPDAFRPDLAMALSNLALRLGEVGRPEAALATAEEAAKLLRELADENPDAFRPNLAAALNNLAFRLNEAGRREDTLAPAQKAVALYRELAEKNPDAFRPFLATACGTLGDILTGAERLADAVEAFQNGVTALREPFLNLPLAFAETMAAMVRDYVSACRTAKIEPDLMLLAPIVAKFEELKGGSS